MATCSWILKRFGMPPLPLLSPLLAGIQDSIVSRLRTETRALWESVPVPFELIKLLEQVVADSTECKTDAILGWFVLIAVCASVRFDDLLHVAPSSVVLREKGLELRAWQTKVERKRRGTYVVCRASLSGEDWPVAGHLVWTKAVPAEYMASDFSLCEMGTTGFYWKRPITHSGFVDVMRRLFSKGVQRIDMDDQEKKFLANIIKSLTSFCGARYRRHLVTEVRPGRRSCSRATGRTLR